MPAVENTRMNHDVIVIGSGISGMVSAVLLARKSFKVLLIEKHNSIAPLLRDFQRKGFTCEPGLHYSGGFDNNGPLSTVFRYLGVMDDLEIGSLAGDGFDVLFDESDNEFYIPSGIENVRELLLSRFPGSSKAVNAYIDRVKYIMNGTYIANLSLDYGKYPKELFSGHTLEDFLMEYSAEPGFIKLLGNYGYLLYGSGASEVPFYIHALIMGFFYNSASCIRSGGSGLVNAFQRVLASSGVDVLTGKRVGKILLDNGRVFKGIQASDGECFEASSCICTVHPKNLLTILPSNAVRPVFTNKIKRYENTFAPFVIFAGTEQPDKRFDNRNFYKFDKDGCAFGVTGKYASCQNAISIIKPCEDSLTERFMNLPEMEYNELKNNCTSELLDDFLKVFPAMKDKFELLDVSTPRSFYKYTASDNGSMYGLRKNISMSNISSVTDMKNFYIAGQSVKIPGFLGAVESALSAVSNITDPKHLWSEIREHI